VVRKVSPGGIITTAATGLDLSEGLAVDAIGNLYIADHSEAETGDPDNCDDTLTVYSGRVRKITPDGTSTTVVAAGASQLLSSPRGIAVDANGILYVADAISNGVLRVDSGGAVTSVSGNNQLARPWGVSVDDTGNLYVSDTGHSRVARISPKGDLANIAGDGAPGNYWGDGGKAVDAGLSAPLGVTVDGSGNLYIADTGNSRVRKVAADGSITTVAGIGTFGHSGDGGPAIAAELEAPTGLAMDASGNLYIADRFDNRIRKVSPGGTITTVAGRGDYNPPLGDGGQATSAALAGPRGVVPDSSGNLFIADTAFFLIRKVSPAGIITTVAGRNYFQSGTTDIGFPTGIAADPDGSLYIATWNTIRKLSPDGALSTIAGNSNGAGPTGDGGPAVDATLHAPVDVARDTAGNLYVAGGDLSGYFFAAPSVRRITPDGIITTIAGNGTNGYTGDGGPATAASFSAAAGIAVDAAGTIYVADVANDVIRALHPSQ
jgi:sugar lactone lactonase YvrE